MMLVRVTSVGVPRELASWMWILRVTTGGWVEDGDGGCGCRVTGFDVDEVLVDELKGLVLRGFWSVV